jgi:hypothetical protein
MREILSLMRVSVRFGRNACVTRPMRETWQVCCYFFEVHFDKMTQLYKFNFKLILCL